jgi:hypothetical protein
MLSHITQALIRAFGYAGVAIAVVLFLLVAIRLL